MRLLILALGANDDILREMREQRMRADAIASLGIILILLAVMFLGFRIYRTCGKVNRYIGFRMAQKPAPRSDPPAQGSPFDQMRP